MALRFSKVYISALEEDMTAFACGFPVTLDEVMGQSLCKRFIESFPPKTRFTFNVTRFKYEDDTTPKKTRDATIPEVAALTMEHKLKGAEFDKLCMPVESTTFVAYRDK